MADCSFQSSGIALLLEYEVKVKGHYDVYTLQCFFLFALLMLWVVTFIPLSCVSNENNTKTLYGIGQDRYLRYRSQVPIQYHYLFYAVHRQYLFDAVNSVFFLV